MKWFEDAPSVSYRSDSIVSSASTIARSSIDEDHMDLTLVEDFKDTDPGPNQHTPILSDQDALRNAFCASTRRRREESKAWIAGRKMEIQTDHMRNLQDMDRLDQPTSILSDHDALRNAFSASTRCRREESKAWIAGRKVEIQDQFLLLGAVVHKWLEIKSSLTYSFW